MATKIENMVLIRARLVTIMREAPRPWCDFAAEALSSLIELDGYPYPDTMIDTQDTTQATLSFRYRGNGA